MTPVHHIDCGQTAFQLRGTPDEIRDGLIWNRETLVYDDARPIVDDDGTGRTGSLITCQHCGEAISHYTAVVTDTRVEVRSGFDQFEVGGIH